MIHDRKRVGRGRDGRQWEGDRGWEREREDEGVKMTLCSSV